MISAMRRLKFVTLLLCLPLCGWAQEKITLTLDDAIEIALSENPTIQAAELEIERFDYQKMENVGHLLPHLEANGITMI